MKVKYGIATTSGTTALHLALVALGVGPGDEVLIPDLTMVACADAVLYTGAKPVFVDIEPRTLTLDPVDLRRKLTRRSRAVMPVHLYGHPARMAEILEISRRYNLLVIEDAAEAHGALYSGLPVGSFGHASCFSFFSNKIITTGEGGMVVTNSLAVAEKAQRFRDLAFAGKRRDYHHSALGFNYRMTNMQAALGLSQLDRIDKFVMHRRECARRYTAGLRDLRGLKVPFEEAWARSVFWMYTIAILGGRRTRASLMKRLERRGIDSRVCFWPLHRQSFLRDEPRSLAGFPVSDYFGTRGLSLPSGNGISLEEVDEVISAIPEELSHAK